MLQLRHIHKDYKSGDLVQHALSDVSLCFRDCEFVSILGPSGSGKTTLLNIIGGLDRYTSGELLINGVPTGRYKERDWDAYRNHSVGFVFQSYNLIPHQTILANVELALTIGGVSPAKRKEKAVDALTRVGLGDQLHKKPAQLSGGQMQRVAIARALVNDPKILLADEPTGALDSETSYAIMEILKEVANDRLVIMVTHNAELAENYSTRIIRLRDGKVKSDTNPFDLGEQAAPSNQRQKKAGMSFLTSLSLSLSNLSTKKGRTFLTAFAGSIGIIGIALILALSSSINDYIDQLQKDTMTSYPITIDTSSMDLQGLFSRARSGDFDITTSPVHEDDALYADYSDLMEDEVMTAVVRENNLAAFKKYLDDPNSEIHSYLGENGIVYTYDVSFEVFTKDPDGNRINTNDDPLTAASGRTGGSSYSFGPGRASGGFPSMSGFTNAAGTAENFSELMRSSDGKTTSAVLTDNYELLAGSWPASENEIVLVVEEDGSLSIGTLYQLGFVSLSDYQTVQTALASGKEAPVLRYEYTDLLGKEYTLLPACDRYYENANGTFSYAEDGSEELEKQLDKSIKLTVSGVIRPAQSDSGATLSTAAAYTGLLTDYLIAHTGESAVITAQLAAPDVNVLTGKAFPAAADSSLNSLASLYGLSTSSYKSNLESFGMVSYDSPSSISLYVDSFEDKESVSECITRYNETAGENNQISYTDYVALLTGSLTSMVSMISYVLIAFVAVSLIVSCIMISIITHISVLKRTKEIGILRALGASRRNISEVFNAETFIVGFFAGLLGVGIAMLLTVPINAILSSLLDVEGLRVTLPVSSAVSLIILSMIITVIGGLMPAKSAAKKDPVVALRSE